MRIRISELRKLVRRAINEAAGNVVHSTMEVKPGTVLRYTGGDMEKPPFVKVLKVTGDDAGGTLTAGDKQGRVHKITNKDLQAGEYEVMQSGAPAAKKPAPWEATR